MKKLKEN